ncbi:hypothetical protein QA601_13540 [Chitinispirillales bacterium ANBcel5]|uniref:hypothetical protein n=1 Tax=Cellulosispirillum alkaliphilum TaxID=3039283 RepID=UPI002A539E88|nr:hypothetical protein [Chitinispirillales bacterium ANBcel5]
MGRKLIAVVFSVALFAMSVSAQNARVDAMSGFNQMQDHARIMVNPANMNLFGNSIQTTYDGTAQLIAIKSFTPTLNFGILYDAQLLHDDALYNHFVNNTVTERPMFLGSDDFGFDFDGDFDFDGMEVENDIDPIPQILVGIDLGHLKVGANLYYERAFYKYYIDNDGDDLEETGRFRNIGFLAGALLDLNTLIIQPRLGMGFPSVYSSLADDADVFSKESGFHFEVGSEALMPLGATDISAGFDFNRVVFQGKRETRTGENSTTTSFENTEVLASVGFFAAMQHTFVDRNMLLGAKLLGNLNTYRNLPEGSDGTDRINRNFEYGIRTGLEKTWDDLKRLDAFIARGGLSFIADYDIARSEGSNVKSRERFPTDRTGFQMDLGLGIKKGVFSMDIHFSPDFILNAPKILSSYDSDDLFKFTATLDFGGSSTFRW